MGGALKAHGRCMGGGGDPHPPLTCSGVCWSLEGMRGSPPASSSSLTHACLSMNAARHSGVRPWWFWLLTFAPCLSSSVHTCFG